MTSIEVLRAANSILDTFVGFRKNCWKNICFARGKLSPHLVVVRVVLPSKIFIFTKSPKPFKFDSKRYLVHNWDDYGTFRGLKHLVLPENFKNPKTSKNWKILKRPKSAILWLPALAMWMLSGSETGHTSLSRTHLLPTSIRSKIGSIWAIFARVRFHLFWVRVRQICSHLCTKENNLLLICQRHFICDCDWDGDEATACGQI